MHLKVSSAKWRPFCLGLNELRAPLLLNKGEVCVHGGELWVLPYEFSIGSGPDFIISATYTHVYYVSQLS